MRLMRVDKQPNAVFRPSFIRVVYAEGEVCRFPFAGVHKYFAEMWQQHPRVAVLLQYM